MKDDNLAGLQTFVAAIKDACRKMISQAPFDRTAQGKVVAVKGNGLYDIQVFGGVYPLPYPAELRLWQNVWVKAPQNNFSLLYIERAI